MHGSMNVKFVMISIFYPKDRLDSILRKSTNYVAPGDIRSYGMLRSVDWLLFSDVSGQHIGCIFEGHAVV